MRAEARVASPIYKKRPALIDRTYSDYEATSCCAVNPLAFKFTGYRSKSFEASAHRAARQSSERSAPLAVHNDRERNPSTHGLDALPFSKMGRLSRLRVDR